MDSITDKSGDPPQPFVRMGVVKDDEYDAVQIYYYWRRKSDQPNRNLLSLKPLCSCLVGHSRRRTRDGRHGRGRNFNSGALPFPRACWVDDQICVSVGVCVCVYNRRAITSTSTSTSTGCGAIVLLGVSHLPSRYLAASLGYCAHTQSSSAPESPTGGIRGVFLLLQHTAHTSSLIFLKNEAVQLSYPDLKPRYHAVPSPLNRRIKRLPSVTKPPTVDEMASFQWTEIVRAQIDAQSAYIQHVPDDEYWVVSIYFSVPLDRTNSPQGERITLHASIIYARKGEVLATDSPKSSPKSGTPKKEKKEKKSLDFNNTADVWFHYTVNSMNKPFLAYLCGGPGDENTYTKSPAVNKFAVSRGYQVLHLDYRGTGKSEKFKALGLGQLAPGEAEDIAGYLTNFTQDKIALDLEAVRLCLADQLARQPTDPSMKLTLLAQSFGGWVALSYLSFYPFSVKEVLLTAAMPPFAKTPQEVYRQLFKRVINRNEKYYELFPGDVALVRKIVGKLHAREEKQKLSMSKKGAATQDLLPDDSGRRFGYGMLLTLGRLFGAAGRGSFDKVHEFLVQLAGDLEKAGSSGPLPEATLKSFGGKDLESFRLHQRPIYGLLHEAIYCHGPGCSSNWAAQTVGLEIGGDARDKRSPCPGSFAWLGGTTEKGFNPKTDLKSDTKIYFTGEMILPFMLEGRSSAPANLLAQKGKGEWPYTYLAERLASNLHNVPVKSVVYKGDMYVDWETSLEMGLKIGGENTKVWLVSPAGDVQLAVEGGRKLPIWVDKDGEQMDDLWDWTHGAVKAKGKTEKVLSLLFDEVTW